MTTVVEIFGGQPLIPLFIAALALKAAWLKVTGR